MASDLGTLAVHVDTYVTPGIRNGVVLALGAYLILRLCRAFV